MPTLSLCLIGDHGTKELKRLVNNVKGHVDEIILISNQNDKKLVKTAKNLGVIVYEENYPEYHQKNGKFDFSSARNSSFAKATMDYIVWCDLDDTFDKPKRLREVALILEQTKTNWAYLTYNYDQINGHGVSDHKKPQIIKNDGFSVWEKPVHENLVYKGGVNTWDEFDSPVRIQHFDKDKRKEKDLRNIEILLAEYDADPENADPRTLHYLLLSATRQEVGLGRRNLFFLY